MIPPPDVAGDGPDPLLQARDVGRRDPGESGRWLYRGVALALHAGDRVTLQGPTGAGKTLLLRGLAGLDPLEEGGLSLLGRPAGEWEPAARRARTPYLHQSPALFPGTVEENLREPFRYGIRRRVPFPARRARELLDAAGRAPGFLSRPGEDLSGGERQVAALVRALLTEPTVLFLDEPTAALDPRATGTVERMVDRWIEGAAHRAFLWVTHDRDQAARLGDRRLRLSGARLARVRGGGARDPGGGAEPHGEAAP